MGKITFFKTMLLAVMLLVGSAYSWGQSTSVTYTFSEKGFANATVITTGSIDANLNYLAEKNGAGTAPTYYTSGTTFRMYNNNTSTGNGCSYTISTLNGAKITALEIYGAATYVPAVSYNVDGGADQSATLSTTTYTISGIEASTSLKFRNAYVGTASAQLRITGFKVTYTLGSSVTTATPTFNPPAGTYSSAQNVELSSTTSNAKIYYTTNGNDPTSASTPYTTAINVASTTTIKAIAYDATDANPSAVASAIYTFAAAPTISITEVTVPAFSAQVGSTDTEIINVGGTNLTANIILTIDGADAGLFSVNSPIPSTGGVATITYSPVAVGTHTATLRLNSTGAAEEIRTLTGSAFVPVVSGAVIISEVFGGGGNAGATLTNDFIELYNTTAEAVTVGGWSVQYYSATGAGLATNVFEIPAGRIIPSGAHFLIQAAAGTGGTESLSYPDAISTLTLGGTAGKIILYNTNEPQTITADIASITGNANFVDYVPYGTTAVPVWGTAMSSAVSSITSATRNTVVPSPIGGQRVIEAANYMYTGNIGNDFSAVTPSPVSTGISTGLSSANLKLDIAANNGNVVFNATAGSVVEIYNSVGQRIVSKNTVDGLNTIALTQKGILLVKVGDRFAKVIL